MVSNFKAADAGGTGSRAMVRPAFGAAWGSLSIPTAALPILKVDHNAH